MKKQPIDTFRMMLHYKFITSPKSTTIDYFREELLEVLMEKYNQYTDAGYDQKTAIKLSWQVLKEFSDAIRQIRRQVLNENTAKRIKLLTAGSITYFLGLIFSYLVVSFVTKAWSMSWMIIVAGTFVHLIAVSFTTFVIYRAKKRNIIASIALWFSVMMLSAGVYLICGFGFHLWHPTWITFIVGILVSYVSTIVFLWNNKKRFARIIDFIIISFLLSVILYLIVSFTTFIWGYSWLIFVGVLFLVMAIVSIDIIANANKK